MKTDICFPSCLLKSSSFSFVHAIIVCILKNNGSIKTQEIVSMPKVRSEKVLVLFYACYSNFLNEFLFF